MFGDNRFSRLVPASPKFLRTEDKPSRSRRILNSLKSKPIDTADKRGVCWLRKAEFGYGFDA